MLDPLVLFLPLILGPMLFSGFFAFRLASGKRPRPFMQRSLLAGTLGPAAFTLVTFGFGILREGSLPEASIVILASLVAQILLIGIPFAFLASRWIDRSNEAASL